MSSWVNAKNGVPESAVGASLQEQLVNILTRFVTQATARGILRSAGRGVLWARGITPEEAPRFMSSMQTALGIYVRDDKRREHCLGMVRNIVEGEEGAAASPAAPDDIAFSINEEADIVRARSAARKLCEKIGFSRTDQIRVATVVSELARNIVQYAGSGEMTLSVETEAAGRGIRIIARDQGPGIAKIEEILAGRYRSRTGLGKGLRGAKLLMDSFAIETSAATGTTVTIEKKLA